MEHSLRVFGLRLAALLLVVVGFAAVLTLSAFWLAGATAKSVQSVGDAVDFDQPVTVFDTIESPDGVYDAVVSESNCGATCSYTTRVQIIKSGEESADADVGSVVLLLEGHPEDVDLGLTWIDDQSLKIVLPASRSAEPVIQEEVIDFEGALISVEYRAT